MCIRDRCEYYALEGLSQLIHTVELVKDRLNSKLEIEGVVFTMYDARTNLSLQVVENVKDNLQQNIYKTIIPRNIRLAEAPSYGLPINKYDPKSTGAESYMRLADEVIESCLLYTSTMEGKNMGILIGKRGQTLDSLQYLTNRVANKMQDGYVRVKLDTEDYRRRRKETLENLAKNIASKVKRTRRTVALEPMNPYESCLLYTSSLSVHLKSLLKRHVFRTRFIDQTDFFLTASQFLMHSGNNFVHFVNKLFPPRNDCIAILNKLEIPDVQSLHCILPVCTVF